MAARASCMRAYAQAFLPLILVFPVIGHCLHEWSTCKIYLSIELAYVVVIVLLILVVEWRLTDASTSHRRGRSEDVSLKLSQLLLQE